MKKKIFKYLLIIVLFISIAVSYLSIVGVETARLNTQIIKQINNLNENLEIELRKIKLVLDPFNFSIKAKTIGPKLKNGEKIIEIESIKTQISLNSFIYKKFSLTDLEISSKPLEIKAYQYDIVCNGVELSSGAIRNHIPELMYKLFLIAGYDKKLVDEKFSGMINALSYGAPPHGGIAPGIDRIIMLLAGEKNIREVTMFPMNQNAQDLMMNAPSEIEEKLLKELNLSVKKNK